MEYLRTRIAEARHFGEKYTLLRFEAEQPIKGEPGQFAMVRGEWGTDPILPRAFSLVETGPRGAILLRQVGKGTRALAKMREGDALFVLGPLGRGFSMLNDERRPVLVAGGIGVAPLIFLVERLTAGKAKRPIFLYGGRTASDLPLRDRIAIMASLHVTTEDGSLGEQGLVTTALERCLADAEPKRVFTCGPAAMLRAVAAISDAADSPCEVALEAPMACGTGTCKGCAIKGMNGRFVYVCSDGPVFDALDIYGGAQ